MDRNEAQLHAIIKNNSVRTLTTKVIRDKSCVLLVSCTHFHLKSCVKG